jgi:hypothetical protein
MRQVGVETLNDLVLNRVPVCSGGAVRMLAVIVASPHDGIRSCRENRVARPL